MQAHSDVHNNENDIATLPEARSYLKHPKPSSLSWLHNQRARRKDKLSIVLCMKHYFCALCCGTV